MPKISKDELNEALDEVVGEEEVEDSYEQASEKDKSRPVYADPGWPPDAKRWVTPTEDYPHDPDYDPALDNPDDYLSEDERADLEMDLIYYRTHEDK